MRTSFLETSDAASTPVSAVLTSEPRLTVGYQAVSLVLGAALIVVMLLLELASSALTAQTILLQWVLPPLLLLQLPPLRLLEVCLLQFLRLNPNLIPSRQCLLAEETVTNQIVAPNNYTSFFPDLLFVG